MKFIICKIYISEDTKFTYSLTNYSRYKALVNKNA